MLSASECLLKAENFLTAAKLAAPHARMVFIQQAAQLRPLARELQMERFGPFGESVMGEADERARPDLMNSRTAD